MVISVLDLPDLVIWKIFSYVNIYDLHTTIPLVCPKWRNLVTGNSFWASLSCASLQEKDGGKPFIINTLKKCRNLRCLDLQMSRKHRGDGNNMLRLPYQKLPRSYHLPRLRKLSVNNFHKDVEGLVIALMYNSPHLECLTLKGEVTRRVLAFISQLKKLQELVLIYEGVEICELDFISMCFEDISTIFEHCPLRSLRFSLLETEEVVPIVGDLCDYCAGTLVNLHLSYSVSDQNIVNISKCSLLQKLFMSCIGLTDTSLPVLKLLVNLRSLSLVHGFNFSQNGLIRFFDNSFPHLKHLIIKNFTSFDDSVLQTITDQHRNLQTLALVNCQDLTSNSFSHMTECIQLETLMLQLHYDYEFIDELHNYFPRLRYLFLYPDHGIETERILRFSKLHPMFSKPQCNILDVNIAESKCGFIENKKDSILIEFKSANQV